MDTAGANARFDVRKQGSEGGVMCFQSNSSLLVFWQQQLRLHILSAAYTAAIARNWLALLNGSQQSAKIRTPLLSLQVQSRRLTRRPPSNEPRRNLWLVK